MIEKFYRYTCADCKTVREFTNKNEPRAKGWAVAAGGKKCYCPACAIKHRSTGCKGYKGSDGQQIAINGV